MGGEKGTFLNLEKTWHPRKKLEDVAKNGEEGK